MSVTALNRFMQALARMKAQLLASDLTGCTHMIVKNISRTVKFLQGVSLGVYFVTERWAIDSINQAQFLGMPFPPVIRARLTIAHSGRSLSPARLRWRAEAQHESSTIHQESPFSQTVR